MKRNKGFTLIELLVVIAIIGILSSIVLASLNTARIKGADAAIKGDLNGIRPQAELYYDSNSSKYGAADVAPVGPCPNTANTMLADPNVSAAMAHAITQSGVAAGSASKCTIANTGQNYAVAVALKSGGAWCVDNSGNSKSEASVNAAITNVTGTQCN